MNRLLTLITRSRRALIRTAATLARLRIPPAPATTQPPTDDPAPPALTMGAAEHTKTADQRPAWPPPRAASRIPAAWNFDNRITDEGIIIPFPIGWVSNNVAPPMTPRHGFPFFNEPGYSDEAAYSGTHSLKLPTRGGSTSVALAAGLLPAMPGADYIAFARVHTRGLQHARVRLVARYTDANPNDPTAYDHALGTERASEPIISEHGWTELRVNLPARETASYIQLELQLLQPEQRLRGPRLRHESLPEDVNGAAYFDDVAVFQTPRLTLRTNSPVNMIESPTPVELHTEIRDLAGEDLHARLWIWDMHGQLVHSERFPISTNAPRRKLTPSLPRFGWYRATLAVRNDHAAIGVRSVDFIWLSPDTNGFSRDPTRFGVVAENLTTGELAELPNALDALRVGAAAVAAWGEHSGRRAAVFDEAVDAILNKQIELTFVLSRTPEELAHSAKLDRSEVLAMLAGDPAIWLRSLTPILSVYGERVLRWQIGHTAGDEAVRTARATRADNNIDKNGTSAETLNRQLQGAADAIRDLVPSAQLVLPWPADHTLDPLLNAQGQGLSAAMFLRNDLPAETVGSLAAQWPPSIDTALVLHPIDPEIFGRAGSTEDLARRATLAWEARVQRISVTKPWHWQDHHSTPDPDDGEIVPAPAAAVWRTLASALAGHDAAARLPTGPDSTVILGTPAGKGSTGVLVGWSDLTKRRPATLSAYLGEGHITATDLFGNPVPVTFDDGIHTVQLGRLPVIVEGVDAALLDFWSKLRFEPRRIDSRAERRQVDLVVTNPWNERITGAIRLAEPESWAFQPRVLDFGLDPGEEIRLPVSLALGVGEETGPRTVSAELIVQAGPARHGPITVPVPTTLGLQGVEMNASYRLARGSSGILDVVIVSVLVTNTGTSPLTVEAYARAPGHRAESAPISAIPPGDSDTATFIFTDAHDTLIGGYVRAGLRELVGTGRLNRTLRIHAPVE